MLGRGLVSRIPMGGVIERRLLVNYRVDPKVMARHLPPPFRPQLVGDTAVAGICLIRLSALRPSWLPQAIGRVGFRSENAAHRVAVQWGGPARLHAGVWVPRRDTSSRLNALVGGHLYPGEQRPAKFDVEESEARIRVAYRSNDGSAAVDVTVLVKDELPPSRLFANLAEASAFFEQGSTGWSATESGEVHDGLRLATTAWSVEPVEVLQATSSFFDDVDRFPPGSVELDNALLMRNVPVTWHPLEALVATA